MNKQQDDLSFLLKLQYFFKKRTVKPSTVYIPRIGRAVYAVNKSRFLSFRTTPKDTDNTLLLF